MRLSFVSPLLVALLLPACGGDNFVSASPGGDGGGSAAGGHSGGGSGGASAGAAGASASGGKGGASGTSGASGVGGVAGSAGQGGGAGMGIGGVSGVGGAKGGAGGANGAGAAGGGGQGGGCTVGTFHCDLDELQSCDIPTLMYTKVKLCAVGLCDAKLGQCDDCMAGDAVSCADASTVKTCGANGKPGPTKACSAAAPYCTGKGTCVGCLMPSQCPTPANECTIASCTSNSCGAGPVAASTPAKTQTPHDCSKNVCDGAGGLMTIADPTDLPVDTGDPCVKPACNGTIPSTTPTTAGTPCNGGVGVCNGVGACGECVPSAQRCTANGVQTCDPTGHWGAPATCAAPTPVCSQTGSQSACVGVLQASGNGMAPFSPQHTCAVLSDGTARCWGANTSGQLGTGAKSGPKTTPQIVASLTNVKQVAAGGQHTCAIVGGDVACWGDNAHGQLGNGAGPAASPTPTKLGLSGIVDLAAGRNHTCALSASTVYCWGDNSSHQLAVVGPMFNTPQVATVPGGSTAVRAGALHTCVINGGQVLCWGDNSSGQLGTNGGNGINPAKVLTYPVPPGLPLSNVASLAAGPFHMCAEVQSGGLSAYCWGDGVDGNFGDEGNAINTVTAESKSVLNGTTSITAGLSLTCGISAAFGGIPVCTGINDHGQLGLGNQSKGLGSPTGVTVLSAATSWISAGFGQACALDGGQLYCWGENDSGQVGVGTMVDVTTPTSVVW